MRLKHILLLLTLFFILYSNAQNNLVFKDFDKAATLSESQKRNKPVFIMYYATWCSHCNKMKNDVFTDANVAKFFNDNFVIAGINGESEQGKIMKEKYNLKSYPNFIFLDKNGTLLYKISGEFTGKEIIAEANNALTPKKQLPYLKKEFEADVSNPDKCLAYITTLLKGGNRSELSVPTHKYLATQSERQLLSEINWRIIANGVSDISSREFQFVIKNRHKFEKTASPARVVAKIKNIITEYLTPTGTEINMDEYEKKRHVVEDINLPETDALLFDYDLKTGAGFEKWDFYKKVTLESTQKMAWNNPSQLRDISQNYFDNYTDKPDIEKAAGWMSRSIELSDSYDGRLLLAKLYLKSGNRKMAAETAGNAGKFAIDMGWDNKEADALLNEINKKETK